MHVFSAFTNNLGKPLTLNCLHPQAIVTFLGRHIPVCTHLTAAVNIYVEIIIYCHRKLMTSVFLCMLRSFIKQNFVMRIIYTRKYFVQKP